MIFRNSRPTAAAANLLTLLFISLWGVSVNAQRPTPKVFMLPTQSVNDSISSIIPERIGEQVREGVTQDTRVVLMPSYEVIQKQLGGEGQSSAAIVQAETLYTQGIGLLTAGEDKKAAEAFQRAVDLMEQNIGDLQNYDVLADALSNLSLAYYNAKFDLDARKRMKDFAHLRPDATLDPEKYAKELIDVLTDEQKKVKSAGAGVLGVTANIEGSKVFVDGVEKGVTPTTLTDVTFGTHYMVVRGPNGGIWVDKIRVRGKGKRQDFKVELGKGGASVSESTGNAGFYTDLTAMVKTGRWGTDLGPYLQELGTQTGAEYITWVVMYKDGSKYIAAPFVHRVADSTTVEVAKAEFNIELSNLRVGVATVSKNIVDAVISMPQDKVVTEVELGPAPEAVVAVVKAPVERTQAVDVKKDGKPMALPPEVQPSGKSSTWTYVAAGGAVILAGALVAGGIYLLSEVGDDDRASGFDAVVSW